jgi:hypothetical protein
MTPNHPQFQPCLSLNEFLGDYDTQAQWEAALEKARWPVGHLGRHSRSAARYRAFRLHGLRKAVNGGCFRSPIALLPGFFRTPKLLL